MSGARTALLLTAIALSLPTVLSCERRSEDDTASGSSAGQAAFEDADAIRVVDDAGDTLELPAPAGRIVSLVPSVTGAIVSLGAADRLVARTRYDLDPALAALPSLGGGLDPSIEGIVALRPDLVVAWNARDDRVLVPRLRAAAIPVYVAEIQDTTALFATLERIGVLVGAADRADSVAGALRDTFASVAADVPAGPRPTALYLIAEDPPRTAGPGTFIGQAI
ncbi:MAG TPA: helical backbone metal receptor, partial [Gemmatimonadota bacterium]|nr:helical backbone metal receptor [Gemmatimonadota bacterium]